MSILKPYYETKLGKLYLGDAFSILKSINEKFNLAILDPPYVVVDDERASTNEWKLYLPYEFLFNYLYDNLYDNGIVFLFGLPSYYLKIAEYIKKRFRVWFDLIYVKPQGLNFARAKIRPMNRHEQILALVKKDVKNVKFTYNYKEIGFYDKPYIRVRDGYNPYQKIKLVSTISIDGFRYPTTILYFSNKPAMNEDEKTNHPTQKPLGLIEWLIKGFSNENNLVLDCFLGSGTTALACEKLNRRWIGIEINKEYCNLSKNRIEKFLKVKSGFLENFLY
jgi:site-specific DNA-methyltransferase (adenine-specific)